VLGALGLREQALLNTRRAAAMDEPADALGRLLAALAARRALLVLDNCEHLVAAAADLADRVLAACPRVRILATSREPLAITGEALWTVGPLTLPPDPAVSSSIHTERAVVSRPAQAETDGALLDGAASVRLRTMAPEQVAARLDDRFHLLTDPVQRDGFPEPLDQAFGNY
jgi:predicted ATPase